MVPSMTPREASFQGLVCWTPYRTNLLGGVFFTSFCEPFSLMYTKNLFIFSLDQPKYKIVYTTFRLIWNQKEFPVWFHMKWKILNTIFFDHFTSFGEPFSLMHAKTVFIFSLNQTKYKIAFITFRFIWN